jgi:type I restriction enzyme R subunit
VPTDAYDLKEAVADKFLVPAKSISVPLKFQRERHHYDELSRRKKPSGIEAEWDEENGPPDHVDPAAVNKWLFNEDTVDRCSNT